MAMIWLFDYFGLFHAESSAQMIRENSTFSPANLWGDYHKHSIFYEKLYENH